MTWLLIKLSHWACQFINQTYNRDDRSNIKLLIDHWLLDHICYFLFISSFNKEKIQLETESRVEVDNNVANQIKCMCLLLNLNRLIDHELHQTNKEYEKKTNKAVKVE